MFASGHAKQHFEDDEGRYFVNTMRDFDPKSDLGSQIIASEFNGRVEDTIKSWTRMICSYTPPDPIERDFSVYTGQCGIAYMFLHLYCTETRDPEAKRQYLERAMEYAKSAKNSMLYKRQRRSRPTGITFMEGDAGPLAMCSILYDLCGQVEKSQEAINELVALADYCKEEPSSELLYGKAGYLYACLLVNKYFQTSVVPTSVLRYVCDQIIHDGRRMGNAHCPLMWEWHESPYLGAAHGVAGILSMLLDAVYDAGVSLCERDMADINATARWLMSLQFPSGNFPSKVGSRSDRLVQWCHGAPGIVPLFFRQLQHMPTTSAAPHREELIRSLHKASDCIWRRGLLLKGLGLCHGVAGNGYAFLYLHNALSRSGANKEEEQALAQQSLFRARQLAEFAMQNCEELIPRPDRPYSLMEGLAGTVCFMRDLVTSGSPCFPAFGYPPFRTHQ